MVVTRSQSHAQNPTENLVQKTTTHRTPKKAAQPTQVNRRSTDIRGRKRTRYHPVKPNLRKKSIKEIDRKYSWTVNTVLGYTPLLSKGKDLKTSKERIRMLLWSRRSFWKRKLHRAHPIYPEPRGTSQKTLQFLVGLHIPVLPSDSDSWPLATLVQFQLPRTFRLISALAQMPRIFTVDN